MSITTVRKRHPELEGRYAPLGSYRLTASTAGSTVVAARTATAGHLLSFHWGDATGAHCYLRLVTARFIATTAYTTAQETGCHLILAPSYTVAHTGGAAVTLTGNKLMQHFPASKLSSCRVATSAALTAGTHTLDANPISTFSAWSAAIGDTVPLVTSGLPAAVLYDARGDESPIIFTQDQGFIIGNNILMGAVGVGRWDFEIEYDEGIAA